MANKGMIEGQLDVSAKLTQVSNDKVHKLTLGVDPGLAEASDFVPGGPDVPSRVDRPRVNPAIAAKERRTPLINVTPVVSKSGHSHVFEPPPSKL